MQTAAVVYVHLWVVEGAIRKWVPVLDNVMYVARDGFLIAALVIGFLFFRPREKQRAVTALFWLSVLFLAILVMVQAIVLGGPLAVWIVGFRNYIAPLLLAFLVVREGLSEFPAAMAKTVLYYAPVQAVVVVMQVLSPKSSFINLQTGGEEAYFTTAGGIVRAAGLFSAPAGLILFTTLAFAVSLASITGGFAVPRWLAWSGLLATTVVLVLGGSRGAILNAGIVLAVWAVQSLVVGKFGRFFSAVGVGLFGTLMVVSLVIVAPTVVEAFLTRFETAANQENSLNRLLETAGGFFSYAQSILGAGAGAHSTAGIAAGSGRTWIENDSARWVAELGLLGLALAVIRLTASIALAVWATVNMRRIPVSMLLIAVLVCQAGLLGGITTQPSAQGYFGIVMGTFLALLLASRTGGSTEVSSEHKAAL